MSNENNETGDATEKPAEASKKDKAPEKTSSDIPILILSGRNSYDEIIDIIKPGMEKLLKDEIDDGDKEGLIKASVHYNAAHNSSLNLIFQDKDFEPLLDNPDSEWGNDVKHEVDGRERNIKPRPVKKALGKNPTPRELALMAKSYYEGGAGHKVPLWASGIVLTIGPFSETDIMTLRTLMVEMQVELGKATNGAIFSGDDCHLVSIIIDHILDRVVDCNVEGIANNARKVKSLLRVSDIPFLLAGALAVIYPKGYPFSYNCAGTYFTTEERKKPCDNIISPEFDADNNPKVDSMVNFLDCMIVDLNKVTPEMAAFMGSTSTKKRSRKEIKDYQQNLVPSNTVSSTIRTLVPEEEGYTGITFTVPTVAEYIEQGSEWCQAISNLVNRAIGTEVVDLDDETVLNHRRDTILMYQAVAEITKHTPWIESIKVMVPSGDEEDEMSEHILTKRTDIKEWLNVLSSKPNITTVLEGLIQEYKEEAFFTFTAMPNYQCPSCGTMQADGSDQYPNRVPMNMVSYFFTLLDYRVRSTLANL